MRFTSLPLIDHDSTVDDALQTMRKAKRSGVVVRKGSKFQLHTAKEVASAMEKGSAQELKDLRGIPIHVPSPVLTRQPSSGARPSTDLLLSSLRKSGKNYGVLSIPSRGNKRVDIYGRKNDIAYVEPRPNPKPKPR